MKTILTRAERDALRKRAAWMKPGMAMEVRAGQLLALLDDLDRAESMEQQRIIDGAGACRLCGRGA